MEGGELTIAITKRARAKAREEGGYAGGEDEAPEESASDVDAVMEDAAKDVAKALGVDPEGVDLKALAGALCDLMDAHALKGEGSKKSTAKKD